MFQKLRIPGEISYYANSQFGLTLLACFVFQQYGAMFVICCVKCYDKCADHIPCSLTGQPLTLNGITLKGLVCSILWQFVQCIHLCH